MATIPLFPLPLVLFPGTRLPLQIFEARYVDMVKMCLRDSSGFGVVLIEQGDEVVRQENLQLPEIAGYATYAEIVDFDQRPNGMLGIMVEGQVKCRILRSFDQADRLMLGDVEFIATEPEVELPKSYADLVSLLKMFVEHESIKQLNLKINYEDPRDVGYRLSELIPSGNGFKQRMLEMSDPLARLDEVGKLADTLQSSGRNR